MQRFFTIIGPAAWLALTFMIPSPLAAAPTTATNLAQATKTVPDRLNEYGAAARARLKPCFDRAGVSYPPTELGFVGLKREKLLEIYARSGTNGIRLILSYPMLAASGVAGPKLREGDRQVPEGIYRIEALNPNSSFHLSLRINYPNAFDRAQAAKEQRTQLGGDIMIHGDARSVGCLAMGDEAAEDLFVLAADTGIENITVVLSPVDFRAGKSVPSNAILPQWCEALYEKIRAGLKQFPKEQKP